MVRAPDGVPRERVFVSEASAGLSGDTILIVGRLAKRLGARLGFAFGAVGAILGHSALEAAVEGPEEADGKATRLIKLRSPGEAEAGLWWEDFEEGKYSSQFP